MALRNGTAQLGGRRSLDTEENAAIEYVMHIVHDVQVVETSATRSVANERAGAEEPCLIAAMAGERLSPPPDICAAIQRRPRTRLALPALVHAVAFGAPPSGGNGGRALRATQCVHGGGACCIQPLHLRDLMRRLDLAHDDAGVRWQLGLSKHQRVEEQPPMGRLAWGTDSASTWATAELGPSASAAGSDSDSDTLSIALPVAPGHLDWRLDLRNLVPEDAAPDPP